eukprot:COSAG02_NODE_2054_length_9987_cov_26.435882_2_plen_1474_part_00
MPPKSDDGGLFSGAHSSFIYAFFAIFFFVANMLFLNLFIALLLDFDLMGSEDMAVSDRDLLLFKKFWCDNATGKADFASGRLPEKRTIHSAIHLHELKDFVLGAKDFDVGTFSMMPGADRFYFNRVLYELKKSPEDVVDSARGVIVHTIPFFELLYALCHIRFSSSCLSLAEEVEKSLEMVDYIENHAAQVIQVGARAFCARRSVNIAGDHAPPGSVWPLGIMHHTEDIVPIPYPKKNITRCNNCTLLNHGDYMWCVCEDKLAFKGVGLMEESMDEVQARSPRKLSPYKRRWDIGVNCALLFELHSLIETERLTPEHLVAQEFDRQAAQDRKKQAGVIGMIAAKTTSTNPLTACLTRGMRKREEKIEMLVLRGKHLMGVEDWGGAMKHFSEALDLDTEEFETITMMKEECERRHRTAEAIRKRDTLQSQNRKALVKSKDSMGKSMDVESADSDLDQAPLIAAVRAVFSLPQTTVVTTFSHMGTKENRLVVDPNDFLKGLIELANLTRSTLSRNQMEVLMRALDQMPCSDYPGGCINYRAFAEMVSNLQSLHRFCDAVVDEGVVLKAEIRKKRKGGKKGGTQGRGNSGDASHSMFLGSDLMLSSMDMVMSQDSMQGGSSLDDNQDSEEEEDETDTSRFYCPLTKELMADPVLACDGYSYERYAFLEYWSDHGQTVQQLEKRMSPVTGEIMQTGESEPNHDLRKEIAAWGEAVEARAKRKQEKSLTLKQRTRLLREQSEDLLGAPDSQADLRDARLEPPPPPRLTNSILASGDKQLRERVAFGAFGQSANERDFDEDLESYQKFSNPLTREESSSHLVTPTGDADEPAPFEREPLSIASLKSSDEGGSQDGRHVQSNPMLLSADSSKSDEGTQFEVEETKRSKKIRKKKKDKKAGGKLSKLNPLASLAKQSDPEVIAQYKALQNTPCHEEEGLGSETLLAGIYAGDVISIIDRVRVDGTIRVQSERGWASVATPDGELQLELIDESTYLYNPQKAVNLRGECDHQSKKISFLLKGVDAVATEHVEISTEIENGEFRVDVWVKCDDGKGIVGWASLKDEDGNVQLKIVDKFDELRFHLRKLSLEALIRQALNIDADRKAVKKAISYNRCIDPRSALVEIIKHLYETTVPVLDLKELPPGWDGSETGRLAEGERVRVNATAGLHGDTSAIKADVKALHDRLGYVVYELPLRGLHGSYEVKIDRIGRSVVLPRENLIKIEDEKANKGLFTAVLLNDVQNLRKLLERTEKPSDALDKTGAPIPRLLESQAEDDSDKWRAEPGVLRVVETVNTNDRDFAREYFNKTLYEVACLKAAEQHELLAVKQLLMEKMLLKAVVEDDVQTVNGLLEDDDQLYMLPMLRTSCSTSGPWGTNPPTSVLALARQIWKDGGYGHHGGMANTMEAAEHLGGKCWLHLSKRFQDEFAEEFDLQIHTLERIHQMHSALTKRTMKKRFSTKAGGTAASEEQTERMLAWKSREFS